MLRCKLCQFELEEGEYYYDIAEDIICEDCATDMTGADAFEMMGEHRQTVCVEGNSDFLYEDWRENCE